MFVVFLLIALRFEGKDIDVNDLYATIIHSSITLDGNTFWISIEGRGPGRSNDLYRFEHATRRISKISTDFTALDTISRLVPSKNGFALVDKEAEVFLFDKVGLYKDHFSLKHLEGCPALIKLSQVQHKEGEIFALTYRDLDQVEDLFLAEVDLGKRTFQTIYVKRDTTEYSYWLYQNQKWFFVNQFNGEIIELDHKFHSKKILVPKIEPILTIKDKKIADMLIAQGNSPYLELVRPASTVGDTLYFWRFHEQTKSGLVLHQLALKNGAFSVVHQGRLVLARFENGFLEFDREEQSFHLKLKDSR